MLRHTKRQVIDQSFFFQHALFCHVYSRRGRIGGGGGGGPLARFTNGKNRGPRITDTKFSFSRIKNKQPVLTIERVFEESLILKS